MAIIYILRALGNVLILTPPVAFSGTVTWTTRDLQVTWKTRG